MEIIYQFIHKLSPLQLSVGIIAFIWLTMVGGLALTQLLGDIFQLKNQRK